MGNIVGEKFDDFVINQINARQSLSGAGFGSATLTPNQLLLLNNRNAWLKLASSVNIVNPTKRSVTRDANSYDYYNEEKNLGTETIYLGTQRLKDIKIGAGEAPNYLGPKFAQKAVLFNTLSEIGDNNKYTTRSGVTKTKNL